MSEALWRTVEDEWGEDYWARVDAAGDVAREKTTTELARVKAAEPPTHYPTNSYQYLDYETRGGQLDGTGLRFRPSTHEAPLGVDGLAPERSDVPQAARNLGVTTLAAHFSHNID